jgi:hypothetical protein
VGTILRLLANGQYGYGPATVMEYTGGKWQSVGSPDFSASRATGESLFVYDGTPYVAYEDGGIGGKTTVMEYAAQPAQSYTVGVAASPVAGGTVIGGGAHTVGASVTVTAAANSGYTFTNWTENGDVVSASASYSFNMPADSLSLTANFTITTTTGGGGGGAPAVYTPTVQTEAASSVTTGSAALNGDITSSGNGNITEYGFLWGTSSSNLNNTLQVGTDNRSGAFTASLGSLTASTTYYFEAYATNSYGTADGAVLNFTIIAATPPLVPAPIFSDVPASFWAYSDIANVLVQALGKVQLANSNAQAVTKFLDDRDIAWWSRGFTYVALQEGIVRWLPG